MFGTSPAWAVSCGVSGSTTQSIGNYNPFTGGIVQTTAHVALTRRTSGQAVTQKVDFILVRPASAPAGLDIRYDGASVLHDSAAGLQLSVHQPPPGTISYNFGGNREPDTARLDLVVTLPPGLDLRTGQSMSFDIAYVCSGTNGMDSVTTPATLPQAVAFKLNVLSALQASYVGPALDFGEIGGLANTDAGSRVASGSLRIASSGPYLISMSAAHDYRMTYPGGDPSRREQSVRFSATLLGQTRSFASPNFFTVYCAAAGISGEMVAMTVRLQEGGIGKNPSPDYRDVLTITVTPSVMLAWPPPANC
jgi:hypothetical protein